VCNAYSQLYHSYYLRDIRAAAKGERGGDGDIALLVGRERRQQAAVTTLVTEND